MTPDALPHDLAVVLRPATRGRSPCGTPSGVPGDRDPSQLETTREASARSLVRTRERLNAGYQTMTRKTHLVDKIDLADLRFSALIKECQFLSIP